MNANDLARCNFIRGYIETTGGITWRVPVSNVRAQVSNQFVKSYSKSVPAILSLRMRIFSVWSRYLELLPLQRLVKGGWFWYGVEGHELDMRLTNSKFLILDISNLLTPWHGLLSAAHNHRDNINTRSISLIETPFSPKKAFSKTPLQNWKVIPMIFIELVIQASNKL